MTQPKLILNLNEQNELAFKISIEGTNSEAGADKPNIRFLIEEGGRDTGWMYPTTTGDDGFVVVNIPNSPLFSEEKSYKGKLEVILGNHYFVPTEVELEFIKPLKVEAAVISKNKSSINENVSTEEKNSVSVASVQLRNKKGFNSSSAQSTKPKKKSITKTKKTWADLSEAEQAHVKSILIKKKKKELREAKKARKEEQLLKEKRLKEQLKSLMSSSLLDD